MTEQQYLLVCLMEECNELSLEYSKALRFGLDDINPRTNVVNVRAIRDEYTDVLGCMEALVEHGYIIPLDKETETNLVRAKVAKIAKIGYYMGISRTLGAVDR